jgi:hypothetical protein
MLQFGEAVWVKDIKTTTHNAEKVELRISSILTLRIGCQELGKRRARRGGN